MNKKGFSQLILVIIVGAVVVIAGGSFWYYKQSAEQNKSIQKQAFNTLPPLIKEEFASDVSEVDKSFIIQGVSMMDFYLQKWFGKSINKSAVLRVGAGVPTDVWSETQVVVENGTPAILIKTGNEVWSWQIQSNKEIGGEWRPKISAHEYVHVYQFYDGCIRESANNYDFLRWFGDGEAEWLSYKAMKEANLIPPLTIPQMVIPQAKQVKDSLRSFENPSRLDFTAYSLYTIAIDYLMKDKPIKALDDFCVNLADEKGMSIPKAFEAAFGITLEKFYEEFEAYRKTWPDESSSSPVSSVRIFSNRYHQEAFDYST